MPLCVCHYYSKATFRIASKWYPANLPPLFLGKKCHENVVTTTKNYDQILIQQQILQQQQMEMQLLLEKQKREEEQLMLQQQQEEERLRLQLEQEKKEKEQREAEEL